jgi:hypothetical protein
MLGHYKLLLIMQSPENEINVKWTVGLNKTQAHSKSKFQFILLGKVEKVKLSRCLNN